jgi:hypothetical protein
VTPAAVHHERHGRRHGLERRPGGRLEAAQLRTRWALINEAGRDRAQSGGFSVTSAFAGANPNVYINTGGSLEDKA